MSKFDEKLDLFKNAMGDIDASYDAELLEAVAKGLGPSIYNADAAYVSTSDSEEVDRVKKNFLVGKLGLADNDELDSAVEAVAEKMGKSNPKKHRAVFYYLLVKHFGKESVYS